MPARLPLKCWSDAPSAGRAVWAQDGLVRSDGSAQRSQPEHAVKVENRQNSRILRTPRTGDVASCIGK